MIQNTDDLLDYLGEMETALLPELVLDLYIEDQCTHPGDPDFKHRYQNVEYLQGEIRAVENEIVKVRRLLGLEQMA